MRATTAVDSFGAALVVRWFGGEGAVPTAVVRGSLP
jgi:hypothetical protein